MVVEGSGAINEWRLTGEPLPVSKRASDQLIGATMNTSGSLVCPFGEATAPSVSRLQLASSIVRIPTKPATHYDQKSATASAG